MSNSNSEQQRGLLNNDSPAPIPSAATPSPLHNAATRHRPGYTRVASVSFTGDALGRDITEPRGSRADDTPPIAESATRRQGLGIQGMTSPTAASSKIRRVSSPLAQNEPTYTRLAAGEKTPVMSPPTTGGFSGTTRYDSSFGSDDYDFSYPAAKTKDSRTSFQSQSALSLHGAYAKSEAGLMSTRSRYDFEPHHCPSSKDIKHGRFHSWVSIGILFLALFSTVFSAIFLILALRGPRYGRNIREHGGALTPASAAFLTSFFAKMIELSFVTVVVAFVGQALARRAFKDRIARGVTLAEMSMRTWVMQPGTMFTNWESVRYAGISFLGIVSLLAAVMALLYTTAATALVQPQLKWPDWQPQVMQGLVKTSFANSVYIQEQCKTPNTILYKGDVAAGPTCLQLTHAAQAYHNFWTYISNWGRVVNNGTGSIPLARRPQGYALYNDNTTVAAPWIEQQNITLFNASTGIRFVNNITMAMPHVGVITAATNPWNNLIQPEEVDGAMYHIVASVPSPILNVLCVTMSKDDLRPFVYELWNHTQYPKIANISEWPYNFNYSGYPNTKLPAKNFTLNGTEFDSIFRWGEEYGQFKYPPVFPKLPKNYNTLLNDSIGDANSYGRTAIYVLGKGGDTDFQGTPTPDNYALCQLQAGMTSKCSTHYTASASGAQIGAVCEDDEDEMRYDKKVGDVYGGSATLSKEYPNVAGEWARSISLKDGLLDGDSSNTHQLTQFIVTTQNISTGFPSMAEALAVLGGCTIIDSTKDTSFVGHGWNYTIPGLDPGQDEYFNATVQALQYASGGSMAYQKTFYIILFGLFTMSFLIFVYFLWHKEWYSDFSEPATMFALVLNSPPSDKFAGSCGCGPSGAQFQVPWKLSNDGGHYYMDSQDHAPNEAVSVSSPRLSRRRWTDFDMLPMTNLKQRFSSSPKASALPQQEQQQQQRDDIADG